MKTFILIMTLAGAFGKCAGTVAKSGATAAASKERADRESDEKNVEKSTSELKNYCECMEWGNGEILNLLKLDGNTLLAKFPTEREYDDWTEDLMENRHPECVEHAKEAKEQYSSQQEFMDDCFSSKELKANEELLKDKIKSAYINSQDIELDSNLDMNMDSNYMYLDTTRMYR